MQDPCKRLATAYFMVISDFSRLCYRCTLTTESQQVIPIRRDRSNPCACYGCAPLTKHPLCPVGPSSFAVYCTLGRGSMSLTLQQHLAPPFSLLSGSSDVRDGHTESLRSNSRSSKRHKDRIPRPRNAFILFRSECLR